jgi:hypothetical protein
MSLPITPSKEILRDIPNQAYVISLSGSNTGVHSVEEAVELGNRFESEVGPWWVVVGGETLATRNGTCRVVSDTTGKAVLVATEKLCELVWERFMGGLGGDVLPPGEEVGVCVCGDVGGGRWFPC